MNHCMNPRVPFIFFHYSVTPILQLLSQFSSAPVFQCSRSKKTQEILYEYRAAFMKAYPRQTDRRV